MAEFAAERLASDGILRVLLGREHPRNRSAGRRRLPTGQRLIAGLRIVVPQAVHVAQARRLALSVVGMALLYVGFVCWDERPSPNEPIGVVEGGALLDRSDRHRTGTAAFGPRAFEDVAIALVCIARLELDGFLTPQTECLLQRQIHANVRIGDPLKSIVEALGLVLVGHKLALRDGKLDVVRRDQTSLTYLLRPPTQMREAVLELDVPRFGGQFSVFVAG